MKLETKEQREKEKKGLNRDVDIVSKCLVDLGQKNMDLKDFQQKILKII